jgi:hypothetical protein
MHQTTTKPAVQAEKSDLAYQNNAKSIMPKNRERNPGNFSAKAANPRKSRQL